MLLVPEERADLDRKPSLMFFPDCNEINFKNNNPKDSSYVSS